MSDDDARVSLVLHDRHLDVLDELQDDDDRDVRSRSEAARELIDECEDLHTRVDKLEARCEELQTEKNSLENRIMTIIDERQERQELVRFVDEEEERRRAGMIQRAKWWAFGKDD